MLLSNVIQTEMTEDLWPLKRQMDAKKESFFLQSGMCAMYESFSSFGLKPIGISGSSFFEFWVGEPLHSWHAIHEFGSEGEKEMKRAKKMRNERKRE